MDFADHVVALEAFDATTGALQWSISEGYSDYNLPSSPVTSGNVVLASVPDKKSSGEVVMEGLNIKTGAVLWHSRGAISILDTPTTCPSSIGSSAFCYIYTTPSMSDDALVAVNPTTGVAVFGESGIYQNIIGSVYETDQQAPTAVSLAAPHGAKWTEAFSKWFGSKLYSPDNSYDFDAMGSEYVGSVGSNNIDKGTVDDLDEQETVAISRSTGRVLWLDHGGFECGGDFSVAASASFLCVENGTGTFPPSENYEIPAKGDTATIEGFNPANGAITWRLTVSDLSEIFAGTNPIGATDTVEVTVPGKGREMLDLDSGRTSPPPPTLWCQSPNAFWGPGKETVSNQIVGTSFSAGCDDSGQATARVGPFTADIGTTYDGLFIWASAAGLQAIRRSAQ